MNLWIALCITCIYMIAAAAQETLKEANVEFAIKLFKEYQAESENGNVVYSPFSIHNALAMISEGCRVETRQEIESLTLGSHHTDANSRDLFETVNHQLNNNGPNFNLSLVNGFFYDQSIVLEPELRKIFNEAYHATDKPKNFRSVPEEVRLNINKWVAQKTGNTVPNLVPPMGISGGTKILLANSAYLSAAWNTPFPPAQPGTFNRLHDKNVTVDMMTNEMEVEHYKGEFSEHLRIPLANGDICFGISKSIKKHHYYKLLRLLNGNKLIELGALMKKSKMHVTIPMLNFTEKIYLKEVLKTLGINKLFNTWEADLIGFLNKKDNSNIQKLHVSNIFHRVFIKVNEFGVNMADYKSVPEALSTTTAGIGSFIADHPFIFYFFHKKTHLIIYHGAVMDPTKGMDKPKPPTIIPEEYKPWVYCYFSCIGVLCGSTTYCDMSKLTEQQMLDCASTHCGKHLKDVLVIT